MSYFHEFCIEKLTSLFPAYPWVIQTNYATNWVQDKRYPSLDTAEIACAASPACKAVNRMSATEYYLAEGDGERDETGTTTYIKGGQEQDQQSFSWPALGYTWHYSAPFALGRTYRTFNTLPEAFRGRTYIKILTCLKLHLM